MPVVARGLLVGYSVVGGSPHAAARALFVYRRGWFRVCLRGYAFQLFVLVGCYFSPFLLYLHAFITFV